MIIRCSRCCLRYESVSEDLGFCPHCDDARIGIGRSFDEACTDATIRLRRQGQNEVWRVGSHLVYTVDVADRDKPDVNLVHMVTLVSERTL